MADHVSRRMYRNHREHLEQRALREIKSIISTAETVRRYLEEGKSPSGDQRRLATDAVTLGEILARLETYRELAYLLDEPGEATDG